MTEEELKEFIKDNLQIYLKRDYEYLVVQLLLDDKIISEDTISIHD